MNLKSFIAVTIVAAIPIISIFLWYFGIILFATLALVIFLFCAVFIVVPFTFRYSYGLQRSLLFLNFVNNRTNLRAPLKHGLYGTRNFYIESENGIKLGVWHVLPSNKLPGAVVDGLLNSGPSDEVYNEYLRQGEPIFLYFHGNAGNRAAHHRIELYKLLQKNNYHVVAVDYRSYGDSTPVPPDETGVVNDAKSVYKWVKGIAPNTDIFIWGHSLGTGVASHTLWELESEGKRATGLILEAPFTNLQEEIRDYPLSQLFRPLPWFDFFFVDPTYENGLRFSSDVYLMNVTAPIMILHAEDDKVVPMHLGEKLYEKIKANRGDSNTVKFISFQKGLGLGHQDIFKESSLPRTISRFVAENKRKLE